MLSFCDHVHDDDHGRAHDARVSGYVCDCVHGVHVYENDHGHGNDNDRDHVHENAKSKPL